METFGRFIARRHRLVLVLALLGFVALSAYGIAAFGKLSSAGQFDPQAPSSQAEQLVDQNFGGNQGMIVLVTAKHGTVDTADVRAVGVKVTATLRGQPYVSNVTSYFATSAPALRSTDHRSALVLAYMQNEDAHKSEVSSLLSTLSADGDQAALVQSGGETGTTSVLTTQIGKDLGLVSIVAVPITVVLLYFVFGGLLAAMLPLSVAAIAIMGTFAELRFLTMFTSVSTYAIDLNIALGLGLAVDYGLLYVTRYREEVGRGLSTGDAIARATATAGRTVLFSATTVALSLTALLVFPLYFLRSFAYAGIAVVVFAVLGALVVVPAMLAGLGARVSTRRGRGRARETATTPSAADGNRFWARIATVVTARPLAVAVPVIAVMIVIGLPLLSVHFGEPDDRALPASSQPHQVGDALRTRFAGNAGDALVVVASPAKPASAAGSATTTAWQRYSAQLSSVPGVNDVQGPGGIYHGGALVPGGNPAQPRLRNGYAYWTVDNSLDPTSGAAARLVHDIRAVAAPGGTTVTVGGPAADLVDQKHSLISSLPWAIAIMAVASFVMLFLFTGSILIPLKSLALTTLTLFTVIGAMIWIFQEGHFAWLLSFTPTATATTIPPLLFVIAFGLSMDYEVFLISRIKEQHDQGMPIRKSIITGMAKAGGIVTTAAALLCVTFFAFGLSKISFLQFFGIGTGLAILIDAFIVRGILVLAVMQVAGERIWWAPAPLRRIYQRFGLHEETPKESVVVESVDA